MKIRRIAESDNIREACELAQGDIFTTKQAECHEGPATYFIVVKDAVHSEENAKIKALNLDNGYISYLPVDTKVELCPNAEIVNDDMTRLRNIPIGQVCAIFGCNMGGEKIKKSYVMPIKQSVDEKGRIATVDIRSGAEIYYDPDIEVGRCPCIELCPCGKS